METTPTPNPSPVGGQRLQRLELVTRTPERYSKRPPSTTALKKVDPRISCEAITRSDTGQSVFLLGVYYKHSQRRIPVAICQGLKIDVTQPPLAYPDILVERSFTEFRRLRDDVYEAAAADEHGSCKYCRGIITLSLTSENTPHRSIHQLLAKPETQCASLSRFLQELIELLIQTKLSSCSGQRRIPEIVCEFLHIMEPTPTSTST